MSTLPLVLNGKRSIDTAKHRLDNLPSDVLYEQVLRPFKAPKTYQQIKTIRALCNDLRITKENEWVGYSSQWWYNYHKMRAYVPQLEIEALDNGDTELVNLIQKARELIQQSRANGMFNKDDDYSLEDFIAENPAFSYSDAKKEQLMIVIDYILKDSSKKGIYLEINK